MRRWRQRSGQQGEQIAVDYLKKIGYQIEQRNFRCRQGEIDIIARDDATLVFIEVKTKSKTTFGAPQAMVTYTKQCTITRVAMYYVQQHRVMNTALRFDVIAIMFVPNQMPEVNHIPAAFSPVDAFFY